MKKILLPFLLMIAIILPTLAFAAYNDVTLGTDVILNVGGYMLNVSGSNATIQSIVVNPSSFSVTLSSGSSIQITSPTYQELSVDTSTFTQSNTCITNSSVLSLSSSGPSGTVTVTPQSTVCSGTGQQTPPSSGGGGGIAGIIGVVNTGSTPSSISSLQTQITNLLALVANLRAELGQTTSTTGSSVTTSTSSFPSSYTFTRNLSLGSTGADVTALQHYLNTHGYPVAPSGPGSLGYETALFGVATMHALEKYQAANNITPVAGYFGVKTRAQLTK